jgi:hypothetical protein
MGLDERREPQPELRELTAKLEAAKDKKAKEQMIEQQPVPDLQAGKKISKK